MSRVLLMESLDGVYHAGNQQICIVNILDTQFAHFNVNKII